MALVGESGSGKSTMAYAAMGDLGSAGRIIGGRIEILGTDLATLLPRGLAKLRGGQVAMVPQDPTTSLSPSLRIRRQLAEVLWLHRGLRGPAMEAEAARVHVGRSAFMHGAVTPVCGATGNAFREGRWWSV